MGTCPVIHLLELAADRWAKAICQLHQGLIVPSAPEGCGQPGLFSRKESRTGSLVEGRRGNI